MIHPDTALRFVDAAIGHGVFATAPIPRGTITWTLDPLDRVMTAAELTALPEAMRFDPGRHMWVRPDGRHVLAWDIARYVNHSCQPNCLATDAGFEIAVADIAAGEQLTNDYAQLGMTPDERLDCRCGAAQCRGTVSTRAGSAIALAWRRRIAAALADMHAVAQPLWRLVPDGAHARLSPARMPQPARSRVLCKATGGRAGPARAR